MMGLTYRELDKGHLSSDDKNWLGELLSTKLCTSTFLHDKYGISIQTLSSYKIAYEAGRRISADSHRPLKISKARLAEVRPLLTDVEGPSMTKEDLKGVLLSQVAKTGEDNGLSQSAIIAKQSLSDRTIARRVADLNVSTEKSKLGQMLDLKHVALLETLCQWQ